MKQRALLIISGKGDLYQKKVRLSLRKRRQVGIMGMDSQKFVNA